MIKLQGLLYGLNGVCDAQSKLRLARRLSGRCLCVCRGVIPAAALMVIVLGITKPTFAHRDPAACTFNGPSKAISTQGVTLAVHGDKICYIVAIGNTCAGCCNVTGLDTDLILPNGVIVPITLDATVNSGDSFLCPSTDARCVTPSNCTIPATIGYEYVVDHADEEGQSGSGCPIVPVPGTGTVWASVSGLGVAHVSPSDGTATICQSIPVDVLHACCEPCTGTCTDVQSQSECPFPSVFTADKHCGEITCAPLDCDDNVLCTDDSCDPVTGTCVNDPNDAHCDDSDECTDNVCDPINDCVYPPIIPCCGDDTVTPGSMETCDGTDPGILGCAAEGSPGANACRGANATDECTCCGDGVLQATSGEQCDDGNTSNNDACLNTCVNARCGDGIVQIGVEQCDDGNLNNNDDCSNNCTMGCGNGIVNTGEQCDDGNLNNNDNCSNNCTTGCGNGIVNTGEQCDDGNANNNDACSNNCTTGCGNGILNPGEECDGASAANCLGRPCLPDCTCVPLGPVCGNNVREGSEECDGSDDDACPGECQFCRCPIEVPTVSEWGVVVLLLILPFGLMSRFGRKQGKTA